MSELETLRVSYDKAREEVDVSRKRIIKLEDELKVKEETSATLRCYPLDNSETQKSVNTEKKQGKFAVFSKAY